MSIAYRCLMSVVLAGVVCYASPALAGKDDGRLDVWWVDVEGGAATLVVTPAGESILFDTGLPGERDPGRINKLARERAGLTRIDHMVITHFDLDHYGGAADVAKLIPVGTLYEHEVRPDHRKRVGEAYLNLKCDKRVTLKPGDVIKLKQVDGKPKMSMDILAALREFIKPPKGVKAQPCDDAPKKNPDKSQNGNSIVTLIRYGSFDMLDAGDLTWNLERRLVCPHNLVGEVDVFQIDHHGLDSSNNPLLIERIKPHVVVMNNGDRKGCMPNTFITVTNARSVKALYQVHRNLRTPVHNTIAAHIANIKPKNLCDGHPIKLSVAPDGKSYTVEVPSTGHKATYTSK